MILFGVYLAQPVSTATASDTEILDQCEAESDEDEGSIEQEGTR